MAMAVVGGAFLSASLQVLFDRMASREFINFFRGQKHDERLLKKLKIMLLGVKRLLNDAELKQWTDTGVKDWVNELKDAIYHTDDLLDEIATEAMRSKLDSEYHSSSSSSNKSYTTAQTVSDLLVSWSPFGEDKRSKIEEIIERLEYFVNAKDSLGLRENDVGRNIPSHRLLPTTCLVDQVYVYGRDDDKEKMIKLLISDDDSSSHRISVIPIVGMVGIGKTTLAQLVYNDARVDGHFDIKSWVYVSNEFEILRVTKTILEGLSLPCSSNDLNTLQVNLRNGLAGKKFMIVLDDVWNENYNHWDQLRSPLGVGKHGSKIIITTRNEGVASIMRNVPIFHLGQLSIEDCWQIFSTHAFANISPTVLSNIELIGKKIVEKCKGLPLAAKTFGGLLRYEVEVEEWVNVLESRFWEFPETKSDILPSLLLSYHHLPSHLKLCFAYCAIIPKDYAFEKDELVQLWIAEGFVQRQQRTSGTIEEIGDGYFRDLISRSLFQQASGNKFLLHDLINDLAQFVAGEYCFRLADDHPHDVSKVRYFSYFKQRYDVFEKLMASNEANCLRTFKPLSHYRGCTYHLNKKALHDVLPTLRCLRVLSLSEYLIVELPDSIGELIHLRYLDLSHTRIKWLPETLTRLCNLETLLLRACRHLTRLPTYLSKLICLRHLDISGTNLREMSMQISKLRRLQRLTNFFVGNQIGSGISELRELHYLHGTLSISNLQNVIIVSDALKANLKNKMHLEELNLEWGTEHTVDPQRAREVLDNLQPHINLKHLRIKNYGGTRFPVWLGDRSFLNLKALSLRNCTNCFVLPPLGQLPSLQELTIKGMNMVMKVGSEFSGCDSSGIKLFQSLEKLTFEEMPKWEEWSILGAEEFHNLLELRIIKCPKLIGEFSKHLPCLKKLEICGCQHLVIENILKSYDQFQMVTDGAVHEHHLSSLQVLEIESISELQILPLELCRLSNLEELSIKHCPMLTTIQIIGGDQQSLSSQPADEMKHVNTMLKELSIIHCPELDLPLSEGGQHHYKFLQDLTITGSSCDSLKSFPLGFFPNLSSLNVSGCRNLESISVVDGIQNLTSLQSLKICDCPNMVSFPAGGLPAPNLTSIEIFSCKKLKALPELMCTLLPSLQSLSMYNLPEIESFPLGGLPSRLRYLNSIAHCPKLQSLPDEGLPSSLLNIIIWGCPLLEVRCQREKGEDWLKISHIPHIVVEYEVIAGSDLSTSGR